MRIVALDFETYFADDFTVSKMTTESYIRDSRFRAHGAAIKWSMNYKAKWYDEPELRHVLKEEDWSDVMLVAHHSNFDGLILSHHYGVRPRMWSCTLSMARLLLGNHLSVSLDSVRKHYGMPEKRTPYHLFKNKRWEELTSDTRRLLAEGCEDEVESIWSLFGKLAAQIPQEEFGVIDTTIKMFTEPMLRADAELLAKIWEDENTAKLKRQADLGVTAKDLQSSEKFAELLRQEGVEPGLKESPKKDGSLIYAFAAKDDFMQELLEDDDERVRALAEARIGVKSTLLQTRASTLGWMAN